MQQYFFVLKMIPAIIDIIKSLESAAATAGAGNGAKKLEALRLILEATEGYSKEMWPSIEKIVGVVVGFLNTVGVFKKA